MAEQNERPALTCNGWIMVIVIPLMVAAGVTAIGRSVAWTDGAVVHAGYLAAGIVVFGAAAVALRGFFTIQPNPCSRPRR
ncbi:MAG TPA: hypothetical protein VEL07_22935 [Planctomycetota bacterium]|nr:hypothetical protein [Planctomycetota bacterium]